jgi:hypothetical protein
MVPRNRPQEVPLDPKAVILMKRLAGEFGDKYTKEFLLERFQKELNLASSTRQAVLEAMEDPFLSLLAFIGHYAFARRGKDRDDLSRIASRSLQQVAGERPFVEVLSMPDGVLLWDKFAEKCEQAGRKPQEDLNRGPVQGMLELAQEVHRNDPGQSIATWIIDSLEDTGRIEPQHERIVDIRGVGPKSASAFIRDLVWLFDAEEDVSPVDRIYVQPVDRWLRLAVAYLVPEPDLDEPPDWVVAGKISKYSRRAKVSGILLNMGLTYFGQRVALRPERFEAELLHLLTEDTAKLKASGELWPPRATHQG